LHSDLTFEIVIIIIIDMKQLKHSRQRDMIRDFLIGNDLHPTADEIYLFARSQDPTISLGTVYRNLNQLTEAGEIRRITVGNGKDRFDFRTNAHGHFICKACGQINDIKTASSFMKPLAGLENCQVESVELLFYGLCPKCKQGS